jgi:2-methylcitrate dehydratase PrpD
LVVHPAIDGCSRLRGAHKPDPAKIAAVRLRVAPLVLDLCNKSVLTRALESKYSIYHAAAIGLVRGKGGLQEFTDDAIRDPMLQRVRGLTTAVADPSITEDQVHIEVTMADGTKLTQFVEQSLGNVHRPLSNQDLADKFLDQAVLALPERTVRGLIDQCWAIDSLDDVGRVVRKTMPEPRESRAALSGRKA